MPILVAASVIVLLVGLRGVVVEWVVTRELRALGFEQITMDFVDVGLSRSRITGLRAGDELSVERIEVAHPPHALLTGRIAQVDVSGLRLDASRLAARAGGGPSHPPSPASLDTAAWPALHLHDAQVHGRTRGLEFSVRLQGSAGASQPAVLTLADGRLALRHDGEHFGLVDLHGRLTLSAGAGNAPPRWMLDLQLGDLLRSPDATEALLRLAGDIGIEDEVADFRLQLRTPATGTREASAVDITGQHDAGTGSGSARVQAPGMRLGAAGFDLARLVPALSGVQALSGQASIDGELRWGADGADASGELNLQAVSFSVYGMWIDALAGGLHLRGLHPLSLATAPELRAQLVAAEVTLETPRADFSLERAPDGGARLRVTGAQTGLAGTRFVVRDVLLDPALDEQRLAIRIHDADLGLLLRMLEVKGISGQGLLEGSLVVRLDAAGLRIEQGLFTATAPGSLRLDTAAAQSATVRDAHGVDTGALQGVRLPYSSLTLDLHGSDTAAGLRMQARIASPLADERRELEIELVPDGAPGRVLGALRDSLRAALLALQGMDSPQS